MVQEVRAGQEVQEEARVPPVREGEEGVVEEVGEEEEHPRRLEATRRFGPPR